MYKRQPARPLVRLAGYLHDIGKPISHTKDGKFIGHELESASLVNAELRGLRFSSEEVESVASLVLCHMYPIKEAGKKQIRKLLAKLTEYGVDFRDFLRLRFADRKANLAKPDLTLQDIRDIVGRFMEVVNAKPTFSVKDLAVNGKDVKERLHIEPGPEVGRYLKELFEYVLEHGPETNTRENLLIRLYAIK